MSGNIEELGEKRPAEIIALVRERFDQEIQSLETFVTYRGLRTRELPNGTNFEGYLDVLPTFEGKNFVTLVTEEIQRREEATRTSGKAFEKVVIVDIGYGLGQFLLDCRAEWQDKVVLIGYGTDVYAKRGVISEETIDHPALTLPPTYQALRDAEVQLINENVIDIRRKLGDNNVDFIVASNIVMHVNYPAWELMKKFYRVLKPNGILLSDDRVSISGSPEEVAELQQYLTQKGYAFELEKKTAFRKTLPDIALPIRTEGHGFLSSHVIVSKT